MVIFPERIISKKKVITLCEQINYIIYMNVFYTFFLLNTSIKFPYKFFFTKNRHNDRRRIFTFVKDVRNVRRESALAYDTTRYYLNTCTLFG